MIFRPLFCEWRQSGCHDPGKDFWGQGEAKRGDSEFVCLPPKGEPKELPVVSANWNMEVGILEIDGGEPLSLFYRLQNVLCMQHLER